MSEPPHQNAPPPQQKARDRPQDRPEEKSKPDTRGRDDARLRDRDADVPQTESEKKSSIDVEEVTVVEGKGGEKNLAYQWVDVWIGNNKPMYIIVTTRPEHALAVTIEQASWKKSYQAKGRVQTDVTPVVPVGTRGQLYARDLDTGEELTVKFVWGWITGPSLFSMLWKLVKRLFTNAKP
jgi:hypothetical protein